MSKHTKTVDNGAGITDFSEIDKFIDLYYPNRKDCLIQILHAAMGIYGYLPRELQMFIAKKLDMPVSEVIGVESFYSFFSMQKHGKHTIKVCMGTACYVLGGKKVVDHLIDNLHIGVGQTSADGFFTFEIARCIGACGLAPAIMIDDDVYKEVTPARLDQILEDYRNRE